MHPMLITAVKAEPPTGGAPPKPEESDEPGDGATAYTPKGGLWVAGLGDGVISPM